MLALGFLGLAHNLLETTAGDARRRVAPASGLRAVTAFAVVSLVLLLALTAAAVWLPGTALVDALLRGTP